MAVADLTAQDVRACLSYDPESGVFISRLSGRVVGNVRADGYCVLHVRKTSIYAHRAAWMYMTGDPPGSTIDHVNGIKSDNRWSNLRAASTAENNRNLRQSKATSASGILGVSWHKHSKRWRAQIRLDYTTIHIGYFDTAEQAYAAYVERKRMLHSTCTI